MAVLGGALARARCQGNETDLLRRGLLVVLLLRVCSLGLVRLL